MGWLKTMLDERPNTLVLILAAAFGLGGFLLSSALFSDSAKLIGSTAPEMAIRDLTGKPIYLKDFRGKPMVVNFWATWCPPCIKEMPMLERAHRRGDIQVIAIASDEAADVRDFQKTQALTMTVAVEDDAPGINRALRVPNTIPYSVFFDANGKVVSVHHGAMSQADFDAEVLKARG
jgi:thiol-disulfide isomerase/thioredoxin